MPLLACRSPNALVDDSFRGTETGSGYGIAIPYRILVGTGTVLVPTNDRISL
jgi:hypothetical protein